MLCFKKAHKLLNKIDFDKVFAKSKKIVTTEFTILYRINTIDHARLGMALSKKMIATSVHRNRLKRLIRETFRLTHFPAVDIVVLAKKGAGKIDNHLIVKNLNHAWEKLISSVKN